MYKLKRAQPFTPTQIAAVRQEMKKYGIRQADIVRASEGTDTPLTEAAVSRFFTSCQKKRSAEVAKFIYNTAERMIAAAKRGLRARA
jgi:hypothetical protein